VTATDIAMHGRGANATGTILITDGGSVTANLLQFGNAGYQSYAVDTTLTLNDGTLSVVNVNYPRDGSYTNNVNATVNLGKGTVITGAAPGVESIWWKSVHINLTSAEGTEFRVDAGKQALLNSTMSGSGKLIKTGEGTLLINAAEGEVDIQSLLVSSGRLDMKEYYTGALEVGLPDDADSTAIFSPGNSVGSLEITGNFILNSGATLLMEFDNTGTDSLLVSGTTTFEEGSILSLAMGDGTSVSPNQQISFQLPIGIDAFDNAILDYPSFLTNLKYNSTTGILSATVDANAVPEPSTWALMALGVIVLFLRKRVRS
ncbi:MAG: PEP-CTERM sorting domain-containing protein, partial [Thermoguttaceae bacterium]|nr:PEP-CTERM sorting domain-containing protein [Thermoguttaceae bacterium]